MNGGNSLQGRVVIVTGGASGIGRATCRLFSERGASVVVADLDQSAAEETVQGLSGDCIGAGCDVASQTSVESVMERAVKRFGAVHILVNSAGITRDAMLHKMSEEDWDRVLDVHLKGAFLCTRAFVRHVRERAEGGGAIVNISSITAKAGNLGQANYVAAKAGIVGLTKTAARELSRYNVRVNAIQPGFIETPMTEGLSAEAKASRLSQIPLGRSGSADDVARVIAFLASDDAGYMTGAVLEVAGGRLM